MLARSSTRHKLQVLTRVALPVKVLLGVAVAAEVKTLLLTSGAVSEGNVVVGDVVEEVNLLLLEEKTSSDGVDGSITPSLVEETTVLVERLKEVEVRLASEPRQATNLKVGPLKRVSLPMKTFETLENSRSGTCCKCCRRRH